MYKCDDYGAQTAAQFIDECQFLANRYMLYTGYSIGINDCVVIPRKVVKSIVDNEFLKTNSLGPDIAVEDVKNGFMISVGSRAKGSPFNVCRITRLLGQ